MIPFFRKIRYKLAANNQFFKYSRYAIGEIILVVIGILIALQINNWNEERKIEAQIMEVFEEIQRDLILSLVLIEPSIKSQSTKDSILGSILSDTLSVSDLNEYPELRHQIGSYNIPFIHQEGMNKLRNYDDAIPGSLKGIYDTIKMINAGFDLTVERSRSLYELVQSNNEYLYQNWKDMYRFNKIERDSILPLEIADFLINDPIYKNMADRYRFVMDDSWWFAVRFASARLYIRLHDLTGVNNMDKKYWDLVEIDLNPYVGTYRYQDSLRDSVEGVEKISIVKDLVDFLKFDDMDFIAVKKDSFGSYYNNTLFFKRDSTDRIIGATRYLNGEYSILEKID